MVTCGYALVDPTVCWVGSRQRAEKPSVHYSHYTEVYLLSVSGDLGSCVDTTLSGIRSYKGRSYSYCPPRFLPYIYITLTFGRTILTLTYIYIGTETLALKQQVTGLHTYHCCTVLVHPGCPDYRPVCWTRIRAAYVQRPLFMLLFLKYICDQGYAFKLL